MNPPTIKNTFPKGESFGRIPLNTQPAINLMLTERERRLFVYYASQKTGFAPARATINLFTGIHPKHVSTVRKALIQKGFICFNPPQNGKTGEIEICWNNIIHRSKALLNSAMIAKKYPELADRIYPRRKNQAPTTQIIHPSVEDITYIHPSSVLPNEPTLRQLFKNEHLQALNNGKETLPDHEGYHEHGLDRIEGFSESQLGCYLNCALDDDELPF